MFQEKELAKECKKYNPIAQKELYDKYSGLILAICYRYTKDLCVAEDLMQDSIIKILTKIKTFKWIKDGSFKAWIKRIAINTCLNYLAESKKHKNIERKNNEFKSDYLENIQDNSEDLNNSTQNMSEKDIVNQADFTKDDMLNALLQVSEPFRTVFNLHVIEGYKHKEIAEMLNINIKTSKTRLFRARNILKEILYKKSLEKVKIL